MASEVAVLIVPLPAQGHLNQLLHLSRLIASYAVPVHFVGSPAHTRQARLRLEGWNPLSLPNLTFHDFHTPSSTSPPKFFSLLQTLIDLSSELRRPFKELLHTLSQTSKRVVVIHDTLMSSTVQDVVSYPNAESYSFQSVSAFAILAYPFEEQGKPNPFQVPNEEFPAYKHCFPSDFTAFIASQSVHREIDSGNIYNTCRLIEGPCIGLLSKEVIWGSKIHWPIGPFNPTVLVANNGSNRPRHRCLEWLDEQEPKSVILLSFGTTTGFHEAQIKEIAFGLEKSNQKFIWVLRDADTEIARRDFIKELPKGYEEKLRENGMGMVVRDWAPQLEILRHPSIGGFMSHCGWNSCMESISMGVPMAAWPIHSDQPFNSFLVTKLLKTGIAVKEWSRSGELQTPSVIYTKFVTSFEIEQVVTKLMGSKEGEEIRMRAYELGVAVRRSMEEGDGESRKELNKFIAHITR